MSTETNLHVFLTSEVDAVGHFQAPATLFTEKEAPVPVGEEKFWSSEPV